MHAKKGKIYGAATVGERGQVVIPAQIRKAYKIVPGDKLIVFCNQGGMIAFVRAEQFNKFLDDASRAMEKYKG